MSLFELYNYTSVDSVTSVAGGAGGDALFGVSAVPFMHSTTPHVTNATGDYNEIDYDLEDVYPLVKQPLHMVIVYSIFYGLLFVLGVLGNVMVIGVVYRNASMHTVINYFIVNMAVADLLVSLLCVPITLLNNILSAWHLGAIMCKLTPFMQGVAVNASVNTLAAISVDRYLAICFPLGHRVTRRVARFIIAAIWCSACVLLSPWAAYYEQRIYAETHLRTVYVCGQFGWPNEHVMRGYFLGVIVVSCYTLPLVFVTVCYTLIGCRVWHRNAKEIANASQEMVYRSKIRVLKMVAVVVTVFTFFWLPLYAICVRVFFTDIDPAGLEFYVINQVLLPPTQWLALSSSSTNPIIYLLFSARFRTGYRDLVAGCCCCCGKWIPRPFHSPVSTMYRDSTVRRSDGRRPSATQSRYSVVNGAAASLNGAATAAAGVLATNRTAKRSSDAFKQRRGGSVPLFSRTVSDPSGRVNPGERSDASRRRQHSTTDIKRARNANCTLHAVSEC